MKRFCLLLVGLLAGAFLLSVAPSLAQQTFLGDGPVNGPTRQTNISGVPATIANGGTYTSTCLVANAARAFDVFAALSGTASLQVQRYADAPAGATGTTGECTLLVGAAVPGSALVLATGTCPAGATYCGDVAANDGMPFQALTIKIVNTAGATNTVAAVWFNQAAE